MRFILVSMIIINLHTNSLKIKVQLVSQRHQYQQNMTHIKEEAKESLILQKNKLKEI